MDISNKEKELMETLYEMGGEGLLNDLVVKLRNKTEESWTLPATMTFIERLAKMGLLMVTGEGYELYIKAKHAKVVYEALMGAK